jgi:uncharacterized iron-regulated protein
MKSLTIASYLLLAVFLVSCDKDPGTVYDTATEKEVLTDFAHVLVSPNYLDIETKAGALNSAVQTLMSSTTDANLSAARTAWREVRQPWEQCEAFLFGPVEDFNFDPAMDTWPVNRVDLDSLLASSNLLTVADIDDLPESLKGFHPIEYLLFGIAGTKQASALTSRELEYLSALTQNLYNTTAALRLSWDVNEAGNFTHELINAGESSQRFDSQKDAFIAIVAAMAGICDEVANGKMEDPLIAQDSTLQESQFAHNSTADFKNNLIGVLNAYLGKYSDDGHGLNELVAAKNLALDNTLQQQMNIAISSFDQIDSNYGAAIYTQQVQIHNAQDAINNLRETLEGDLMNFVLTNIIN